MTNLINRPMPLTIEEIDSEWLTAALRTRVPDAAVNAFEISGMIRGTCTKIWLKLDLNDAAKEGGVPEIVVLKGGFEPHSRIMKRLHDYEAIGYRDLFPNLKLHTPGCYFADYDDSIEQGIVIMDDLVTRGVTFCNPLKPQAHDQVARRLTALAQYHAQTWNSPEHKPGGRWAMVDWPDFRPYIHAYLEPDAWRRLITSPRGASASVRFHDPEWVRDTLERMYAEIPRGPVAIVHGDTHLGNLYIEQDGTPGFFNSMPHRTAVMQEVAYHVTCALDPADRGRWEGALVRHYLDELARAGVEPPDFDEAMRQYGLFLAWGYLVWIVNEKVYQTEAVNTACTARFSVAMIDHDTIGLLAAVRGTPTI